MPAFITGTQFLVRYDWRWVAKNLVDGTTVPATSGDTASHAVLAALIEEASDMVMAAAAIGKRYTLADLTVYGGNLLIRLVSDLTMGLILKRRARASEDEKALSASYEGALEYLEQLRRGDRIFYAVPNVPEAGLPDTATMVPAFGSDPQLISQNVRIFGLIPNRGQSGG